jgi:homoserine/homoserine lactone efflux protein
VHWEIFLAFAATNLLFAFSPGPAVLLTVSHGMRGGWGASLKVALGVQAGNAVYFALSALGLGAVLHSSEQLFHAVKWAGAAYLVWLGVRTWRGAKAQAEAEDAPGARMATGANPFAQAVLTQLANPKAVLFFGALMPQFIDPHGPLLAQYLVFGAICFATEVPVLAGYGWLAAQGGRLSRSRRVALWRERVSGGLLVGVGASLAAIRRAA